MSARLTTLVIVASFFLAASLSAQPGTCFFPSLDDGFGVGCCQTPIPNLPTPPPLTVPSDWGVYNACTLGYTATGQVTIGTPIWFEPDYALIPITIQLPGLAPVSNLLLGKYARTWVETALSGLPQQVWRILVNGDIPFIPTTACPPPTCLPPSTGAPWFKAAHMVGHIDYACDPSIPLGYSVAFSLSHLPGCIQHASFSTDSIPALATSQSSYHLVGPAPFTFTQVTEPQGTLAGDTARSSILNLFPFFYLASGEAEVPPGGSVTTVNTNCLCSPLANGPWRHQVLSGTSCCLGWNPAFQSVPVPGTPLAPTGFAAFTVGQWNVAGNFPDTRTLVIYIGVMTHYFTCGPVLQPFQVVTGVGTTLAIPAQTFPQIAGASCFPPTLTLSRSFIDLQNMLPLSNFPNTTPGLGSFFASDYVLSLNIL